MGGMSQRTASAWGRICLVWTALLFGGVRLVDGAPEAGPRSENELWRRTLDLVSRGDFEAAEQAARQVRSRSKLTQQVHEWLADYQAKESARREADLADFEKYVGYAKARVERKEFKRALDWAMAALDCSTDREAFLASDWLTSLVNDALTEAGRFRKENEWQDAWGIYWRLSELHEQEPRYEKLAREGATHVRLDRMFKEGSHWDERIEKVRWKDAERALSYIERYYVDQPVDFKDIAERGLEQLQLLVDSKTAQERIEGLADEDDRRDFKSRIQERLDQVRAAPALNRRDCAGHFRRAVKDINDQTVRLSESLVVSELMRGALEPLDDFTTIIWPQASREFEKHTRGDFVGVGISIIKNRSDEIEVVTPLEDTPAYRAGIQAGDIITHVDGESLKDYSVNKVVDTITGPRGTGVSLTVRRGEQSLDFPLERAKVRIRSVKGVKRDPRNEERWDHWLDKDHGIGYVRVTNFQKNTVEDVQNALAEMRGLRGLVLDLRGNPGGLLDSAWNLSSLFLHRGDVVVSTKGVIKADDQVFEAPSEGAHSQVPLVVLVDERSASASEIVSGAVRDNHRGVVIGERTFGKFSVQNLISLSRSGAKLKITTAKYYLPNGDSLHRGPYSTTWGVSPDVPVHLVRKELLNVFSMQREANLLGPPKVTKKDDEDDGEKDDEAEKESDEKVTVNSVHGGVEAEEKGKGDEEKADGKDKDEKDKLPPIEQPDENDRPKSDPQLDTALLLMRVTVIGESHPTLAIAKTKSEKETGNP